MRRLFILLICLIAQRAYTQSTSALYATLCEGDSAIISASVSNADSVQWYRNHIALAGANRDTLVAFIEGTYYIRAFLGMANGCMDQSGDIYISFDRPYLADDSVKVHIGRTTSLAVLDNDNPRCAPFDINTFRVITPPALGKIEKAADGQPHYKPLTTESGTDWFTYTVKDVEGREPPAATVRVELVVDCAVIYPNPVDQVMHITLNNTKVKELKIYDAQGREVYRTVVDKPRMDIGMNAMAQGWYLLEFVKSNEDPCILRVQKR